MFSTLTCLMLQVMIETFHPFHTHIIELHPICLPVGWPVSVSYYRLPALVGWYDTNKDKNKDDDDDQ